MLPTQREVEIPLLQVLAELGEQAKPRQVYPLVTKKFPTIRDEDLVETVPSGGNRWTNRIQWVRQKLVSQGEMDSLTHGIWRVTVKGRQRLAASNEVLPPPPAPTFLELYEQHEASFRGAVA